MRARSRVFLWHWTLHATLLSYTPHLHLRVHMFTTTHPPHVHYSTTVKVKYWQRWALTSNVGQHNMPAFVKETTPCHDTPHPTRPDPTRHPTPPHIQPQVALRAHEAAPRPDLRRRHPVHLRRGCQVRHTHNHDHHQPLRIFCCRTTPHHTTPHHTTPHHLASGASKSALLATMLASGAKSEYLLRRRRTIPSLQTTRSICCISSQNQSQHH